MTDDRKIAAEALTKHKQVLQEMVEAGNPEAWPAFTGMPSSTLFDILEWSIVKGVAPDDLLLTVAGIAFAHGKRIGKAEATPETAAASNSSQ